MIFADEVPLSAVVPAAWSPAAFVQRRAAEQRPRRAAHGGGAEACGVTTRARLLVVCVGAAVVGRRQALAGGRTCLPDSSRTSRDRQNVARRRCLLLRFRARENPQRQRRGRSENARKPR